MLKHLPKDALRKLEKTVLSRKKSVYFNTTSLDRRVHSGTGSTTTAKKANNTKYLNIDETITKFHDQLED